MNTDNIRVFISNLLLFCNFNSAIDKHEMV